MRIGFVVARGCVAIVSLIISAATVVAQTSKLPNPADPDSAAPAVKYESAFSDYQPFQEQKSNAWKQVNKEVADNPGMGSMKDVPGKTMPGMNSKTADAPMSEDGAGGHDMHSKKDMPDKVKPGKSSKTADTPVSKEGHDAMRKDTPQTATGHSDLQTAGITGTGVVQGIDKANGKVKVTHDPIEALGWPKMTMFFRLKDSALADQVKEGDKVEFSLEKSASGYVISGFQKGATGHDMKQMKK
jgi:Cu/Ag efflux protein CusF